MGLDSDPPVSLPEPSGGIFTFNRPNNSRLDDLELNYSINPMLAMSTVYTEGDAGNHQTEPETVQKNDLQVRPFQAKI